MRKGISLPIEMIVVIAIAVLVLVVIAAFFVRGTAPIGPGATALEQAFAGLCSMQTSQCGVDPAAIMVTGVYDLDQNGQPDPTTTLAQVCTLKGIAVTGAPNPCRKACGCPQ